MQGYLTRSGSLNVNLAAKVQNPTGEREAQTVFIHFPYPLLADGKEDAWKRINPHRKVLRPIGIKQGPPRNNLKPGTRPGFTTINRQKQTCFGFEMCEKYLT